MSEVGVDEREYRQGRSGEDDSFENGDNDGSSPSRTSGYSAEFSRRQVVVVAVGVSLVLGGILAVLTPRTPDVSPDVLNLVGLLTLVCFVYVFLTWLFVETDTVVSPPVETRSGLELTGMEFESSVKRREDTEEHLVPVIEENVRGELRDLSEDIRSRSSFPDGGESRETGADTSASVTEDTPPIDESVTEFIEGSSTGTPRRAIEQVRSRTEPWWTIVPGLRLARRLVVGARDAYDRRREPSFETGVEQTVGELARLRGIESGDAWYDSERADRPDEWTTGEDTTKQWTGLTGLALLTLGIGVLVQTPGLVLVSGLLLGVVGYTRVTSPPSPSLAVEREFDAVRPAPGDAVTVSVSVTNEGDAILPDLRLADAVPDRLAVEDGSPRHATALRPGETTTFEYDVLAVYGDHEFGDVHVASRCASGRHEHRETVETERQRLVCEPGVLREDVPLHPAASGITGRVRSETGGSGQEFRVVREYRTGDPLRRIDWNRFASTRELSTVEFTEEQAATVVLVIDARTSAFDAPSEGSLSALDRSLAGASQLFTNLDSDGDSVGLASINADWLWIGPGSGQEHRVRLRDALFRSSVFDLGERRSFGARRYVRQLGRRLPNDAQLLVFSPLVDETAVDVIRRLSAQGYETTVFSPDPTNAETVGSTVARLRRDLRLDDLRRENVPLIDWQEDEPLETAVARVRGVTR